MLYLSLCYDEFGVTLEEEFVEGLGLGLFLLLFVILNVLLLLLLSLWFLVLHKYLS